MCKPLGLVFMKFHKLGSGVCVDFSIMMLNYLAHSFPTLSWTGLLELGMELGVDLCIWFYQLQDDGSTMIVGVFINLITKLGQFRYPLHYF